MNQEVKLAGHGKLAPRLRKAFEKIERLLPSQMSRADMGKVMSIVLNYFAAAGEGFKQEELEAEIKALLAKKKPPHITSYVPVGRREWRGDWADSFDHPIDKENWVWELINEGGKKSLLLRSNPTLFPEKVITHRFDTPVTIKIPELPAWDQKTRDILVGMLHISFSRGTGLSGNCTAPEMAAVLGIDLQKNPGFYKEFWDRFEALSNNRETAIEYTTMSGKSRKARLRYHYLSATIIDEYERGKERRAYWTWDLTGCGIIRPMLEGEMTEETKREIVDQFGPYLRLPISRLGETFRGIPEEHVRFRNWHLALQGRSTPLLVNLIKEVELSSWYKGHPKEAVKRIQKFCDIDRQLGLLKGESGRLLGKGPKTRKKNAKGQKTRVAGKDWRTTWKIVIDPCHAVARRGKNGLTQEEIGLQREILTWHLRQDGDGVEVSKCNLAREDPNKFNLYTLKLIKTHGVSKVREAMRHSRSTFDFWRVRVPILRGEKPEIGEQEALPFGNPPWTPPEDALSPEEVAKRTRDIIERLAEDRPIPKE